MEARLIIDQALPGAWNMAVDEALLLSVADSGVPCLRFYRWATPTLSLGYFQALDERQRHAPSRDIALVRRSTGGGAIVHHHEWTYSFTCPVADRSAAVSQHYYLAFHETLIELLAEQGIAAALAEKADAKADEKADKAAGGEPFLCFERRATGDVVVGPHKVLGSAQRRHQRGLLQHGSLLLATSPHAPQLTGLSTLVSSASDSQWLAGHSLVYRWQKRLERRLGLALRAGRLSAVEHASAARLERSKFADKGWTERR